MKKIFSVFGAMLLTFSTLQAQSGSKEMLVVLKNDGQISAYEMGGFKNSWNYKFSDSSYNKMRNQFNIENNTLYAASTQNTLVALDVNTGKVKWQKKTFSQDKINKRYETSGQRLPILNDLIYVANNVNGLNAFNKKSGALVWNGKMHYPFNNYPPVVKNSKLYIQSAPLVYCFDALKGNLLWYKNFEREPMYTLINANNESVFIGDEDDQIYALDAKTGTEKWKYKTSYQYPNIDEGIVLSKGGNQLVFASKEEKGSSVTALDAKNGQEIWKTNFDNSSEKVKTITGISDYYVITTDDSQKFFYMVDAKTGKNLDVPLPKEQPLSNVIAYHDNQIAFLTKSFFVTYNLGSKTYEYKPISITYEVNDSFNLHFDIANKAK